MHMQARMKGASLIILLTASSASLLLGFFLGISFSLQIATKVQCGTAPRSIGSNGDANSIFRGSSNLLGRFWGALRTADKKVTSTSALQSNATPQSEPETVITRISNSRIIPKAAVERLPPDIVVSESDLHLRRIWGNPREDTAAGKYLLVLTVGYAQKTNVNATVHKFSDKFDVVLFHYDGKTTEWDAEFAWSKNAVHVSARKQAKWWYAKRFLHPSVVAPYDYVFLWDEDLDAAATSFDADEYVRIVRENGLHISQPALDSDKGDQPLHSVTARRTGGEVHRCRGFVEVMAPVFGREAWACVWHMMQNDLVHGWGLDWYFWRCVDDPQEQIGVVDAQFVVHLGVPTLLAQDAGGGGSGGERVKDRQQAELQAFVSRMKNAEEKAQAQSEAEAPPPPDEDR